MSDWNLCTSLLKLRTQLLLQRPVPLLFYLETSFSFVEPTSVPYCGESLDRENGNGSVFLNEPSTFIQWTCSYFLSSWDLNSHQGHSWGPSEASLTSLCKAANWCLEYKCENASFFLDLSYRPGLTFAWKFRALRIKKRFFLSPLRPSVASLPRCPAHHASLGSQSSGLRGLFSAPDNVLLLPA